MINSTLINGDRIDLGILGATSVTLVGSVLVDGVLGLSLRRSIGADVSVSAGHDTRMQRYISLRVAENVSGLQAAYAFETNYLGLGTTAIARVDCENSINVGTVVGLIATQPCSAAHDTALIRKRGLVAGTPSIVTTETTFNTHTPAEVSCECRAASAVMVSSKRSAWVMQPASIASECVPIIGRLHEAWAVGSPTVASDVFMQRGISFSSTTPVRVLIVGGVGEGDLRDAPDDRLMIVQPEDRKMMVE